jgi:hypothetical protein
MPDENDPMREFLGKRVPPYISKDTPEFNPDDTIDKLMERIYYVFDGDDIEPKMEKFVSDYLIRAYHFYTVDLIKNADMAIDPQTTPEDRIQYLDRALDHINLLNDILDKTDKYELESDDKIDRLRQGTAIYEKGVLDDIRLARTYPENFHKVRPLHKQILEAERKEEYEKAESLTRQIREIEPGYRLNIK